MFFENEAGKGKVPMEDLPFANLWDGEGCGGSQKAELATVDAKKLQVAEEQGPEEACKWNYAEVDVATFMQEQFPVGSIVDAWDAEEGQTWRMCTVVKHHAANQWTVEQSNRKRSFRTSSIRHPEVEMQRLLKELGQGLRQSCRALPVVDDAVSTVLHESLTDGKGCEQTR